MKTDNWITAREIAMAEEIHPVHARRLLRQKDAPDPVRIVGNVRLYDVKAVAAFFDARRRRKRRTA